jgi:2-polyprenyl-3-methyl-5-hydroxy-6-metoxy-1,4-benzoquinol methylase
MRPPGLRPVRTKTVVEIAREWDALADERSDQVDAGMDLSLEMVVLPALLRLARPVTGRVLDVGCGVGAATAKLAPTAEAVVAIDPSLGSIAVAKRRVADPNVEYYAESVEQFAASPRQPFDLVIANMTLMDVPELDTSIAAIAHLLRPGGRGVFSITHPWFWPVYWEYCNEPWFEYHMEIFVEANFTISHRRTKHITTHVHRPLEMYVHALGAHGLTLRKIVEPMPASEQMTSFPTSWRVPRFLLASFMRE